MKSGVWQLGKEQKKNTYNFLVSLATPKTTFDVVVISTILVDLMEDEPPLVLQGTLQ